MRRGYDIRDASTVEVTGAPSETHPHKQAQQDNVLQKSLTPDAPMQNH